MTDPAKLVSELESLKDRVLVEASMNPARIDDLVQKGAQLLRQHSSRIAELEEALRRLKKIVGVTLDKDFGFWSSSAQVERRSELYPAWVQARTTLSKAQDK